MKKYLYITLCLCLIFGLTVISYSAPSQTSVIVSGDLTEQGSVRFVSDSNNVLIAYYTFGTGRYFSVDSCYLGTTRLPFEYEGVFIEYQGQNYYSTVRFNLTSSELLTAYDRGDSIFLDVSAPSYSSNSISLSYLSDDGYTLSNEGFISRITYDEGHLLADQRPLIPYYVTYSDGRFVYTYRFDSAYFNKQFPGVTLTYDTTLYYEDNISYIKLKFNDFENSSLLYNDNVGINVVYSLLSSAPVGSGGSGQSGSSPNDKSDAFYFLTFLGSLAVIPYTVVSPVFDIDVFGVNLLYGFSLILGVVVLVSVVFIILKVVKK